VGWTSCDVVRWFRVHLGKIKVGHAGTLDPFAQGIVLVCVGSATKRVPELMALEKEYEGCLELGIYTDTLDVTGTIIQRKNVPAINMATVRRVASDFIGEIEQIPPMHSAVKVQGKRLYKIARSGYETSRKSRVVTVFSMEVLSFKNPLIFFRIRCSKGTYVRSLAAEWAERMGTVGYLKTLTRTRVGPYTIDEAYRMNMLEELYPPRFCDRNNL
jgi:tRNA pseudouridine55 synthase